MTHLSVDGLASKDFILLAVGSRFVTNLVTLITAIWSYIEYGNPEPTPGDDSGLYGLVILIFIFFSIIFVNDVSSLPVNIFYIWSLLSSEADLTNKWVQTVAFASPIASATVFVLGTLFIVLLFTQSGLTSLVALM